MGAFFIIFSCVLALILYVAGFFIQEMSSKGIFYGVRIPVGYEKNDRLLELKREYRRNFNLSFLGLVAVCAVIMVFINYEFYIFMTIAAAIISIVVINANYYIIHKKARALKKAEGWKLESKNVVVVDTNFRKRDESNKRLVVSGWWFILPVSIIIITLVVTIIKYPSLPDKIPTHLNEVGKADIWSDKSPITAFSGTIIQAVLTYFLYWVYKLMEKTKQSLNGGNINKVRLRSRRMRYLNSGFMVALSAVINIVFFLISLQMMGTLSLTGFTFGFIMIAILVMPLIFMLMVIAESKKDEDTEPLEVDSNGKMIINRDDDDYYVLGFFYYNKNDPSLFVEKRAGIGMDFNYAKPAAKVVMGLIAAILIGVLVLIASIPGSLKERKVDLSADSITIHGVWGVTINKTDIEKVQLEDKFPKVLEKTNGADIGNKYFGKHRLESSSNALLYIVDSRKPFVAIYIRDQRLILINFSDDSKTKNLYEDILNTMNLK
ncbi:MAG: DUF1648 domain-containing protein [Bacillota bacterium]|nr:DUF1648 domain-containing protein [Bacillota bacterium]